MRPIELYNLGVVAARTADTEAKRRSAVGRIYYGLHHEACCRFFRINSGRQHISSVGKNYSRHMALVAQLP